VALLKTRPRIALRAPAVVLPGDDFEVEIHLAARRAVDVEFVSARLLWIETLVRPGQQPWHSVTREIAGGQVRGPSVLPQGSSVLPARLALPRNAPPSYRGRNVVSQYHLDVHASIPWWPDRRVAFLLAVAPPPARDLVARPVRYSTAPDGPRAGEPYLEASLASDVAEAGGTVSGAFALGNAELHRFGAVEIALVAQERARVGDATLREEVQRFRMQKPPGIPEGGAQSTFQLRVPEKLSPTTTTDRWALSWFVEVEVRRAWGKNLVTRVPLTIVSRGQGAAAGALVSPPVVGSDRLRALWSAVGAPLGLALSESDELRGSRGPAEVTVRREKRGRDGLFLVGELRYPSLQLGLEVRPRRGLGDVLLPGFRVFGSQAFAEHHHVTGRDEGQVRALLEGQARVAPPLATPAVAALAALHANGAEVELDDSGAAVAVRDAGLSSERLAAFATRLLALADAVAASRREIPPPAPMREGLARWQELAARLSAPLETARMAVEGRYGGVRAAVCTDWSPSGEAQHTTVTLHPEAALRSEQSATVTTEERTALTASLAPAAPAAAPPSLPDPVLRYPASARALLSHLLETAHTVDLSPEGLVAVLPAPLLDPAPALDALEALSRLRSVLYASDGGPYR